MKTERFNENYTIVMYIFYSIFSHLWWALLHFSLWVPNAPFCLGWARGRTDILRLLMLHPSRCWSQLVFAYFDIRIEVSSPCSIYRLLLCTYRPACG